jgi:hypothetical protein
MLDIAKKDKKYGTIFGKIDVLIKKELEDANDQHGEFKSCHEGISVLLEEIEEAEDTLKAIKKLYNEAWEGVKNDDYSTQIPVISKLYLKALFLGMETIQIGAMAEKYDKYLEEHNPQKSVFDGQVELIPDSKE